MWAIVQQINAKANDSVLVSDGHSVPVCVYANVETVGVDALKATSLRKLGLISGRHMIRLLHRSPHDIGVQAYSTEKVISPEAGQKQVHKSQEVRKSKRDVGKAIRGTSKSRSSSRSRGSRRPHEVHCAEEFWLCCYFEYGLFAVQVAMKNRVLKGRWSENWGGLELFISFSLRPQFSSIRDYDNIHFIILTAI